MFRINEHYSIVGLAVKLDANYAAGDYFWTLTYAGREPSKGEAQRCVKNFLDCVGRAYRKQGIVFKWVLVTEYEHTRIHHHVVASGGLPLKAIAGLWKHGMVRNTFLYGETFYKLAEYLIKETRRTFRNPESATKRRYGSSRNFIKPITKVEYLSKTDFDADPKPPKGYGVESNTVYRGENPFTGARYIEYVALPIGARPMTPGRRRRGRTVKPRSPVSLAAYRKAAPKQERMDC
jgi:hypothetical protein